MPSIVVKIGSSSVTRSSGPDPVLLTAALDAALTARSMGWHVVLVSSGAISSGAAYLSRAGTPESSTRLAAAVGQPILIDIYKSVAEVSGRHISQILISEDDLRSPDVITSITAVLSECARAGIVPIVNGNDVTDVRGSDNDAVAVGIAVASGADKLLLLTDVPGVYRKLSGNEGHASDLSVADIRAVRVSTGGMGRGGMRSKLMAAELAAYNGIETYIGSARASGAIISCVKGEIIGTRIISVRKRFPVEDRWIAGVALSHGVVTINRSAEKSIQSGSSLFASGIKKVSGQFASGDIVSILTPSGKLIARGECRISADLMALVRSMQTEEIAFVMTEILRRFRWGNRPKRPVELKANSVPPDIRPQLARALSFLSSYGYEHTRQLALEILNLFPGAAVDLMLHEERKDPLTSLRERYCGLSSDLSLIDRRRLVVF